MSSLHIISHFVTSSRISYRVWCRPVLLWLLDNLNLGSYAVTFTVTLLLLSLLLLCKGLELMVLSRVHSRHHKLAEGIKHVERVRLT